MTLQELQEQALKLPTSDRWRLVEAVLKSLQQETQASTASPPTPEPLANLHPWTQSLIGVIHLETENPEADYVDYLEEKYR